jgi:hypothetical protein
MMATDAFFPQDVFAKNRAEEFGYDVWESFVIPPFFQQLSVGVARKPKVIVGGRGCGKTMLLRYLSHDSMFSPRRSAISTDSKSHVGLYWRADTQFAQLMAKRGVEDDTWYAAFRHLAALAIGREVLRSVRSISSSTAGLVSDEEIARADFSRLHSFDPELPPSYEGLIRAIEDRLDGFETWVNDVRHIPCPRFLPGGAFVRRLVDVVRSAFRGLCDAVFYVYIDEYENLAAYQQRIINTWLKHSEPPLVFNVAMKRNGFKTPLTTGEESISQIHDYRVVDLERYDLEAEFPVFAAEILLLNMMLAGYTNAPVDPNVLRDPARLPARKDRGYCSSVLGAMRGLLPDASQRDLAEAVFRDKVLYRRLRDTIKKGMEWRRQSLDADQFVDAQYPEASIVNSCLLFRESLTVEEIGEEFGRLHRSEDSRFALPTDWVHNNFIGCLLQLYEGLPRPCPFYGGFNTFCYLSRGNLGHFLELCHQSFSQQYGALKESAGALAVEKQAEAARQVSADFLKEIRSFGPHGNDLHTFVLRLGSVFSLSQQRLAQSEPERNHFSIHRGQRQLGQSEDRFLTEAVKWSVLFEEKETKRKAAEEPEVTEYILNPIYAPYFHISYRKRRKLDMTSDDFICLMGGTYDDVSALLQQYAAKWDVSLSEAPLPLFDHLAEEPEH